MTTSVAKLWIRRYGVAVASFNGAARMSERAQDATKDGILAGYETAVAVSRQQDGAAARSDSDGV